MRRHDAALVLFTLSAEVEGRRKKFGPRPADLFRALLGRLEALSAELSGVDLLVASPSRPALARGRHLRQRGRSFGESLRLAVEDTFDLGYRRVVVIGNDAPEISASYVRRAFRHLEDPRRPRATLGPAADGGYALLGLNRPCRGLFDGIPWGSSEVARLTRERLAAGAFEVAELRPLEDIDDPRSLHRFLRRAAAGVLASLVRLLRAALAPAAHGLRDASARPPAVASACRPPLRAPPLPG